MWNLRKYRKMLNMGGVDYDETVGREWWLERREEELGEMEPVAFLELNGDGEPPTGGDGPAAAGDGLPAAPGRPPPPPLPASDNDDGDANMLPLLSSDDEDEDNHPC